MTSEVIIDAQPKEISIALLEDKRLVEYQREPREASFSVGNIYVAKVKKLMPGLNACFVDVGYERDAFLHYLDLGEPIQLLCKVSETGSERPQETLSHSESHSPTRLAKGRNSSKHTAGRTRGDGTDC